MRSVIVDRRLSCPMAYGLFLDQGSNHFPCIARQILNPREAQDLGISPIIATIFGQITSLLWASGSSCEKWVRAELDPQIFLPSGPQTVLNEHTRSQGLSPERSTTSSTAVCNPSLSFVKIHVDFAFYLIIYLCYNTNAIGFLLNLQINLTHLEVK